MKSFDHQVGFGGIDPQRAESEILAEFLDGADLLIDATAEDNVSRALAHLTHPEGMAQVYVWSVEGHGGVVALIQPGKTGCYLCLESALSDASIPSPPPPTTPNRVQPRGCSDVTFVAPHVDLEPLSVEASRMAIAYLSGTNGYGQLGFDVLVFQIRDPDGTPTIPTWSGWSLPPRTTCQLCGT